MNRLEKIIEFVRNAHEGQMRAGGIEPYFNHLERVAQNVSHLSESFQVVAYCHDYLEDVEGATFTSLIELGVSVIELIAIDSLTKRKGESFKEYITRLENNEMGRVIKAADRADNLLGKHPTWSNSKIMSYIDQAELIFALNPDLKVNNLLRSRMEATKKCFKVSI
jgi:guanosine-3',5'-bis(diphosphate) 3'-pyrophosphohydrolase